jgi:hypothetical protein
VLIEVRQVLWQHAVPDHLWLVLQASSKYTLQGFFIRDDTTGLHLTNPGPGAECEGACTTMVMCSLCHVMAQHGYCDIVE